MDRPPTRRALGRSTFLKSLRFALAGIRHTFLSQPNMRYQLLVALFVISLGLWLGMAPIEWALIVSLIFLVLALETLNTAIEAVVDLVTDEYRELARVAKDASAGAVLLVAVGSVLIGVVLFLPKVWEIVVRW